MILVIEQPTHASRSAEENFRTNLHALRQAQPWIATALEKCDVEVEWVFGRDRALTGRDSRQRWIAECSLPRRAAREMLKRLDMAGAVACFLAPTHGAQIAVALEVMRPEQALVVLVPKLHDLAIMLRCENLASAIEAHRLWFVAGERWVDQLSGLYADQSGLATPAQFVRVPVTENEVIEPLIAEAQQAISEITSRRAAEAQSLRARAWVKPSLMRLCVVAPTRFRLWNDVGHALVAAAEDAARSGDDITWTLYDADDPACSSPLALASLARECSAVLTANTARCDLPGMLPDEMPWITWVTTTRIPSFTAAGKNDRLLLADPNALSIARKHGWPDARLSIATWPPACGFADRTDGSDAPKLSIIADTTPLGVPDELNEYSSHVLLWNAIRDELLRDPFALGDDVQRYLAARMKKLNIAEAGLVPHTFISRLIVLAFQQGLARMLLEAKLAVQLHGEGWQKLTSCAPHAHGPIESREHLAEILGSSHALVHVWATRQAHPIDFTGLPVVRACGSRAGEFMAAARRALSISRCPGDLHAAPLSGAVIRSILFPT